MDFGFMRASSHYYACPNKIIYCIVISFDRLIAYLIIIDGASRQLWTFLTKSKKPPIDLIKAFMSKFGNSSGGLVHTDQGGELARSTQLINMLEKDFHYTVESTGADSPLQNGAAEIYNDKQGVRV